jgi:signal transduction histidine kinase
VAYSDVEEAYLSGLLHDIGQLLLLGGMEENYGKLLESCSDEMDLLNVEQIRLGTDHTVVGAWLADQWKLSSFMADSMLFHHKTAEEIVSADRLSQIIWSSHVLCDQSSFLDHTQKRQTPDLEAITDMLGIDAPRCVNIYQNCSKRVAAIAESLGICENLTTKTFPRMPHQSHDNQRLRVESDTIYVHLEESIRDMAMMQPLQHDLTSLASETEILIGIRESARILFGSWPLAFFLVARDNPSLSGAIITGQPEVLQRLEIPLDVSQSLAAEVFLGKQPRSTFEADGTASFSLYDVQIVRALGTEGVLYIPLSAREENIGFMAYGISSAQHLWLRKRLTWMMSFARMAAISIEAWRDMQGQKYSVEAALAKRFEQLARKAIHEAGNPLSIINNYLGIVRKKLPDSNSLHQEFDVLREEIARVTKIIGQMSTLSEVSASAGTLDINTLIESMLVLYGKSLFLNRGIAVEKSLDHLLMPTVCNRDSIKQILLNLWNNAADAMVDGGSFTIATLSDIKQNGNSYFEIRMSDTGPGLPPDVIQRVFQPLEPNRRPGHSGIGLSIVAGLIEQLDGQITFRSKTGHGTTFSILLPQSTENEK